MMQSLAPLHVPTLNEDSPAVLGRYRLGGELASGGMATVYLALPVDSTVIARPLALKRIHPHLATEPEFVAMFIDEARIASKLHHPNLCGVLDFGEVDGTYFMTMEYLLGEPLNRLYEAFLGHQEKHISVEQQRITAQIIADAAEGLHAAHELRDDEGHPMNVVHRDVSPSNLFVTYDGLTRVVDFGIASAADRLHHTATGSIKGKFSYMSPEQLRGEKVGRSADIWALGVVLWECLAGRRLFRRNSPSLTMLAALEGRVPPLAEVVRGIDPSLASVVGRALAHDREARFPTALMLAEALQRFLARTGSPSARSEVGALLRSAFPESERERHQMMKAMVEERRSIDGPSSNDTHPSVSRTGRSRTGIVVKANGLAPVDQARTENTTTPRAAPPSTRPWKTALASGLIAALLAFGAAWTMRGLTTAALPAPVTPSSFASSLRASPRAHAISSAPAPSPLAAPSSHPQPTEPETPPPARTEKPSASTEAPGPAATTKAAPSGSRPNHRTGFVSVSAGGERARVYFRGRLLGATPGRFTLPAGRQTLSIRPGSGGRARVVMVRVRPGSTVRVQLEL